MSAERRGASRMGAGGTSPPPPGAPPRRACALTFTLPPESGPNSAILLNILSQGRSRGRQGKSSGRRGRRSPQQAQPGPQGFRLERGESLGRHAVAAGGGGRTATSSTRAASGSAIQPRGGRAERKQRGRPRRVRSARRPRARTAHAQGCRCREPVREWSSGRKSTETHHTTHFPKAVTMKDRFKEANVPRRTRGLERWLRGEEHWVLFRRS